MHFELDHEYAINFARSFSFAPHKNKDIPMGETIVVLLTT